MGREVDARIGGLCRDVPIPTGLKERLLAGCDFHAGNFHGVRGPRGSRIRGDGRMGVGVT